MIQRKIPPCSNLIIRVDLPRPKEIQQEYTYHCLQCRQRVFDRSDHGVCHAFCPSCGRCFTQAPWGFASLNPLVARPDYPTCGNCFWRLAIPCGCACGCISPRLPSWHLCFGCGPVSKRTSSGCGYVLGGHAGARFVWERHIEAEHKAERAQAEAERAAEEAAARERDERAERWRNADRTEREAMLAERRAAEKTQGW